MGLDWKGDELKAKMKRAQLTGVDSTMAACVLHAKRNHSAGAHGADRFETQTGVLERSVRIVDLTYEKPRKGVLGIWGSTQLAYAIRIEFGFQGKDSMGRVIDQQAYPFLRPAAQKEYPKLAGRIRRALKTTGDRL
ncbi:MAG: phage morphogenesis protein [Gammaproteobacteria bacterium]|nr:phage morphogenesis protein [Gammaproteobacteria bacterium]